MNILGINSVYHESAAALIQDGLIVAAAEEERFNRVKHGKPARVDNPHVLPVSAIDFCLKRGGVSAAEVDLIAFSFSPTIRKSFFAMDVYSSPGDWGSEAGEACFLGNLRDIPHALETLLERPLSDEALCWVPHHVAHAASAFYPSGFERAALLVLDGIGEYSGGMIGAVADGGLTPLEHFPYPHSLGFVWEKLCCFLGFSEYDACKVMGMAAYGDHRVFQSAFSHFMSIDSAGRLHCDLETLRYRLSDVEPLERLLGTSRRRGEALEERHFDVAAALQHWTDRAVLAVAEKLRSETGIDALCYAGGVALNCTTNWKLHSSGLFSHLSIPSAPHDAGTALGAALHVAACRGELAKASVTPFIGPDFTADAIAEALRRADLDFAHCDNVMEATARLIADGNIVGWFQGRMEFGPRALGNRSLLADPRTIQSRQRMNDLVKRREHFRPFAPSVLASHVQEWFEVGAITSAHELMLVACPVVPSVAERIPAVLHVDGTARVQIVHSNANRKYYGMIEHFHRMTGVPMVLNTSFNDSEPIVCTPDEAIKTFLNSHVDALVLGDFVVMARGEGFR